MLAGKYRVEKVLGFGGMGVVVSAFRGDLEQRVAVKFLSQAAAERPDAAERFRREARAAAKIRSEHVARVLDVGTLDTGLPYMVMEFLEGNDVSDELQQYPYGLPMVEAVDYMLQAIEALAEAHAAGVVHRDLKPGNIYLARRADGTRRVKVLDFGISKALSGTSVEELSLTKTAALIGSPLYMAPEQMRSAKDVDTRADIWSLGAMLYEMLTGQPPYTGDSIPQLCAALLHDDPIPLRQHRPEIPEGLQQAVLRCLMKDRNQRFPTVFELGRALLPFAQPDSRIHVERAERMLRVSDVTMSGMTPATERVTTNPQGSTPIISAPLQPMAITPQPVIDIAEPTVNSWGQTGPVATPRRRGALIAVGVVTALLAGAVGIWAAGRGDEASASTKPSASAATSGAEPAPVDTRPAEPAALVIPDPAPAVPDGSASAGIARTPPIPAAPVATPPAKIKAGLVAPAPYSKAPPKKPEPKKPESGITDFGGRR